MRKLLLTAAISLLATACATAQSAPGREAFSRVQTRAELFDEMMAYGGDRKAFEAAPTAYHACLVQEYEKLAPQDLLDAADQFVADKTQANWDRFDKIHTEAQIPDAKLKAAVALCKAESGL